MEEKANAIDIVFEKNKDTSLPNNLVSFLNKTYSFKYNNNTKIRDLFKWIMINIWEKQDTLFDEYLREHIRLNTNKRIIKLQLDYNLKKFLCINNLNKLVLSYIICPAGGAGARFEIFGEIRINPDETIHKYIPHVHIYKDCIKDDNHCVRIVLKNLTQMKNDKKTINDLFSNKEKKIIFKILKKHRNEFINYYNSIQRGEYPEPIYIDYYGKIKVFK